MICTVYRSHKTTKLHYCIHKLDVQGLGGRDESYQQAHIWKKPLMTFVNSQKQKQPSERLKNLYNLIQLKLTPKKTPNSKSFRQSQQTADMPGMRWPQRTLIFLWCEKSTLSNLFLWDGSQKEYHCHQELHTAVFIYIQPISVMHPAS